MKFKRIDTQMPLIEFYEKFVQLTVFSLLLQLVLHTKMNQNKLNLKNFESEKKTKSEKITFTTCFKHFIPLSEYFPIRSPSER